MKQFLLLILLFPQLRAESQAVFHSTASGNWSNPSSWILISGSSATNYPVSGDSVTVTAGNMITVDITAQCDELLVNAASTIELNSVNSLLTVSNSLNVSAASLVQVDLGLLTVTGTMSVGAASTIRINAGALTVVGFMTLTYPAAAPGTTLLDIEGGAFTCAGGMTITATAFPANRFAEMRIFNGVASVAGGLATLSSNAKINFTGTGTLNLAGVISVQPTNFIAGVGRVIYIGIPGSNQLVAALSYYRLVITGFGSGTKQITGAVNVADSLVLLSDTVTVSGSGVLNIANGSTIVRTGGKLLSVPDFQGIVDIVYNDIAHDTTGLEMPVNTTVLRNLTISDPAGIALGNDVTMNGLLTLQQGAVSTGAFLLAINNPAAGTSADPAVSRTNGYVNGTIRRTIGTVAGMRDFPFGISNNNGLRDFNLNYSTAPAASGSLTVHYIDSAAPSQSGLPVDDAGFAITDDYPFYWQADAADGLSGGIYSLTLSPENITPASSVSALRMLKRPSAGGPWTVNGTAGTNSGTTPSPVVVRDGMNGFSQFTIGTDQPVILPMTILSFTGSNSGTTTILRWSVSGEINSDYFDVEAASANASFAPVGRVSAAGNSYTISNYQLLISNTSTGIQYYRLKLVTMDGSFIYSAVIQVNTGPDPSVGGIRIFPTVTKGDITIEADANGSFQLFNMQGVYLGALSAGTSNLAWLPAGMYLVRSKNSIVKFVKQ